jgi:2-polyprenyl-6-methoxyphenol hydroxylase-like FAD-dependent oxidoreductase
MMVLINRGDYFQCGFIIRKDTFATDIHPAGLDVFRASLTQLVPFLADRVEELQRWDQIKLLTVQVNHLKQWHIPGLLCIGDAAHAMSPVGGIGINLAIQDAVATANILTSALLESARRGTVVTNITVERVQHRRDLPTRLTQRFQVFAHGILNRILGDPAPMHPNWLLRILSATPLFRRLAGRMIGMGVRPEKIRT